MARQRFPQRGVHTRMPADRPGPERAQHVGIETCGRGDMTRGTLVPVGLSGREARGKRQEASGKWQDLRNGREPGTWQRP